MKSVAGGARWFTKAYWVFMSVPILVKMVGIGAIVATVFGLITFVQTKETLKEDLNAVLADRTISEAESLAAQLARPLSVHDVIAVTQALKNARARLPDLLYVIVRDPDGAIVSHTFSGRVPADLVPAPTFGVSADRQFRVVDGNDDGLIFEASRDVLKGHGGSVQLGMSRRMIDSELASLRNAILVSLGFCLVVGIGLAIILTFAITRPVYHLTEAVRRIRRHELSARAKVFSDDEIGNLARAFNDMAEILQRNEATITEKEKARTALVGRIISSQENERKVISRELHDQVGQSILALLVDIKSQRGSEANDDLYAKYEAKVEKLIDEVRQVSKGMHPSVLDDYGLDVALKHYTEETAVRYNVRLEYESGCADGASRLPEAVEIAFYRVAQEAVLNALRHASPEHISVILLSAAESATLLIEDDGTGFAADDRTCNTGLGLVSMRERISLLGGDLDIISAPGEGTTVRARVALDHVGEFQI